MVHNSNEPDNAKKTVLSNIISLESARATVHASKQSATRPHKQPILNIPPTTKKLLGLLIAIFLITEMIKSFNKDLYEIIIIYGSFIPVRLATFPDIEIITPFTIITYSLLHATWLHILMNAGMLLAIGSACEKTFGPRYTMIIYSGSIIIAALTHFLLDIHSPYPMLGASGGISGLFGGLLYITRKTSGNATESSPAGLAKTILLWVAISIILGLIGSPDGSNIAWAAHIGGFIGGIGVSAFLLNQRQKKQ